MRYVILLFGDETAWSSLSEDEQAADMARHNEFPAWCAEHGVSLEGGDELDVSATAVTRRHGGVETDGSFLELKEQLGGYYLISTDDPALAKEAMRQLPNYGANELRPLVDHGA